MIFKAYLYALKEIRKKQSIAVVFSGISLAIFTLTVLSYGVQYGLQELQSWMPPLEWMGDWVQEVWSGIALLSTFFLVGMLWIVSFRFISHLWLSPFLDRAVERSIQEHPHWGPLLPGPSLVLSFRSAIREGLRTLWVHGFLSPLYLILLFFPPLALVLFFAVESALVSREYYLIVAPRLFPNSALWDSWKASRFRYLGWGAIQAVALAIPLFNVVVPLFGVYAMVSLLAESKPKRSL